METKSTPKTNGKFDPSKTVTPANIAPYISTIVPVWTDGDETTGSLSSNYYLFTGRRYDPESEVYYFRNRYYSPELGRFVSRDVDYLDGLNLYLAYFVPCGLDAFGYKIENRGLKSIGYSEWKGLWGYESGIRRGLGKTYNFKSGNFRLALPQKWEVNVKCVCERERGTPRETRGKWIHRVRLEGWIESLILKRGGRGDVSFHKWKQEEELSEGRVNYRDVARVENFWRTLFVRHGSIIEKTYSGRTKYASKDECDSEIDGTREDAEEAVRQTFANIGRLDDDVNRWMQTGQGENPLAPYLDDEDRPGREGTH